MDFLGFQPGECAKVDKKTLLPQLRRGKQKLRSRPPLIPEIQPLRVERAWGIGDTFFCTPIPRRPPMYMSVKDLRYIPIQAKDGRIGFL